MELIYCAKCGKKIPPGGPDEGKRYLVDGEPFCPKCYAQRPSDQQTGNTMVETDPVLTRRRTSCASMPAARRPGSQPMPAVVPGRKSSRRLAEGRTGGPGLWLAGAAVFLLAAAATTAFLSRGAPRDESPGPAESPSSSLGEPPPTPSRNTPRAGAAADDAAEIREARDEAVGKILANLREQADRLALEGDYDGAMALYDGAPPAELAAQLAPSLKAARTRLGKDAASRVQAAADKAEAFSRDGLPDKALAELDGLKAMKYAAWNDKLAALRQRLEGEVRAGAATAAKRREAEARARACEVLDRFAKNAVGGDCAYAARTLIEDQKALDQDARAAMSGEMEAAGQVARSLIVMETARKDALHGLVGREVAIRLKDGTTLKGTVEEAVETGFKVRVTYKADGILAYNSQTALFGDMASGELARLLPAPEVGNDHDRVAATLIRASMGDIAGAGGALKAVPDHPLGARLAARLAEAARAARELRAEAFWKERIGGKAGDRYTDAEAADLLASLNAFQQDFGDSEFAKAREQTEAIARLRPLVALRPAAVQALFKGKVVRFDPATMEIELAWDFADPAQVGDFSARGKPDLGKGRLVLKDKDGLSFPRAFASRLKVTCDATCTGAGAGAANSHLDLAIGSPSDLVALCRTGDNIVSLWQKSGAAGHTQVGANRPSLEAACANGTYSASAGGRQIHEPIPLRGTLLNFSINSYSATATFRKLRATGTLDRGWLEKALADGKAVSPAPARAPAPAPKQ